ncbi:hypothetical protein [Cohnella sp. GCM10027633]|uniref:hypothetical protein n=1 Tax=unclassified Cohnella TaxID=2636738 RepID=UPI0036308C74
MRFTLQYVPLSKIKPDDTQSRSKRWRQLKTWMSDCVHLLVVRRNKKDGTYSLLGGRDRYDFLVRHTKKQLVPCIVDRGGPASDFRGWLARFRNRKLLEQFPQFKTEKLEPSGSRIIRAFLRQEPRFARLSPAQKVRVLMRGVRYKRTVIDAMKAQVDELLSERR